MCSILGDICLMRGSKCTNHPKRSSEFVVFMSIFLFLFCDWFILLGRVDNPMRDELDIVFYPKLFKVAVRSIFDQIWRRCFEERVNLIVEVCYCALNVQMHTMFAVGPH